MVFSVWRIVRVVGELFQEMREMRRNSQGKWRFWFGELFEMVNFFRKYER